MSPPFKFNRCSSRDGLVLLTVLGLISLLLALAIGLAVKVNASIAQVSSLKKTAQCYLLVQAAIKYKDETTGFEPRGLSDGSYGITEVTGMSHMSRLGKLEVAGNSIKVYGGPGQASGASEASKEFDIRYNYLVSGGKVTIVAIP